MMQMHDQAVPVDERPSLEQLHNKRKAKTPGPTYSANCLGTLRLLLETPPPGVIILSEHVTCNAERVRIPFMADEVDTLFGVWA